METTVTVSGPLFDGRLAHEIEASRVDVQDTLAAEALDRVQARLGQVLQHPTGRYRSHVAVVRAELGDVVTDGGIVYGPWLEGTASRNQRSRFKGYRTFRLVAQELQADAVRVAEPVVGQHLKRVG